MTVDRRRIAAAMERGNSACLNADESDAAAAVLELVAFIETSWPSARFTDAHRLRYNIDLARLDPAEALAAVEAIKLSRAEFPPAAGAIARRVAEMQIDAPDWGEVKRQLVQRWDATVEARERPDTWVCPHGACDGSGFVVDEATNTATDCACRPAKFAARRGDSLHPLLTEFIEERYVTWSEVEAVGRGMATTLEAQMRQKWDAFAQRAVESRVLAVLDGPATLRRLAQARAEDEPRQQQQSDAERRTGLRRPDFVAALPPGR